MNEADAWADRLRAAQQRVWLAEWWLRDLCAEMPAHLDRPVAQELDTSHRNIARWRKQAQAIPPDQRDSFYSVRGAVKWAKKEGRL